MPKTFPVVLLASLMISAPVVWGRNGGGPGGGGPGVGGGPAGGGAVGAGHGHGTITQRLMLPPRPSPTAMVFFHPIVSMELSEPKIR